jgi:hypothetical protein
MNCSQAGENKPAVKTLAEMPDLVREESNMQLRHAIEKKRMIDND